MDVDEATDQMIRLARVVEAQREETNLLRLAEYAEELYQDARQELAADLRATPEADPNSEGLDKDRALDAILDSTPLGMAYRSVLGRLLHDTQA